MAHRRIAIATALFTLLAARAYADEDEGGEAPAEVETASAASADSGDGEAPAKPSKRRRRGKGRHSFKYTGRVVPEDQLRVEPLPRPSGKLHIVSINNPNEQAKVNIYNSDGSYNVDALAEVNFVLRCRRTDAEKDIDPQLVVLLAHIYDHFGKPLEIVSAYRNQRKLSSNHTKGMASDIRIEGVSPKVVRAYAETLDRGGMGIGIYPRSQFVHVDVRTPPSYRWVDYSPPNSNAAEKRPPRGWKRKKLQS
jgi:uncharacterized protein YcbK (DUF882 family)